MSKPSLAPTMHQFDSFRTTDTGELQEAATTLAGTSFRVLIEKKKSQSGSEGRLTFLQSNQKILVVRALLSEEQSSSGGSTTHQVARLIASGSGIDYEMILRANDFLGHSSASLEIRSGKNIFTGSFDFVSQRRIGVDSAPDLPSVFSPGIKTAIQPLLPALEGLVHHYQSISNGMFGGGGILSQRPIPLMLPKAALCRAGCWAAAGAVCAAGCAGSVGTLCVVGSAACGAVASMCSDSCG